MPESSIYDIAVIGGGLAGLTLAIQAADAGYRVVLFEKEAYPFHKVCGEYISMESWPYLQSCGLPLADWNLPVINKLIVTDTKGKPYAFSLPLGGFGVSRYRLDNALYAIALQKGVSVYTECRVTDVAFRNEVFVIQTPLGEFTARVTAGCYGKRSNLDLKWRRPFTEAKPNKLNNLIGVKYHIRYPHPHDTIALHNFVDGYCGISRIENGDCCLCYLSNAHNLKKSGNSIKQMEENILFRNKALEKIFSGAEHLYTQPLAISQVSFQKKTQVHNHVLLLGDAAGMIPPLCGNGMSMAMHAAKLALHHIRLYLDKQRSRAAMENGYIEDWQKHFGTRTRVGRAVQYFFGGSQSTAVFLQGMHAMPGLSNALIRQTHGKPF